MFPVDGAGITISATRLPITSAPYHFSGGETQANRSIAVQRVVVRFFFI